MNILVLDTIHGGREISRHLTLLGHCVDSVDVYRDETDLTVEDVKDRHYDLIVAPVHLDRSHPLIETTTPVISHHDAVRMILEQRGQIPFSMVEITGMQGKTTTARALAHLMKGPGILHTSAGVIRYPEQISIAKKSITPASVLFAAERANEISGWLIVEESLGVSGSGSIGVLTSEKTYPVAKGTGDALTLKTESLARCETIVCAPDISWNLPQCIHAESIATCEDVTCTTIWQGETTIFENPLLLLTGYRASLCTAAACACVLGLDPAELASFEAVRGRMSVAYIDKRCIVDNANSGTNAQTTGDAVGYARNLTGTNDIVLVVGAEEKNICEGFPESAIISTIVATQPRQVILVGAGYDAEFICAETGIQVQSAKTLDEGQAMALQTPKTLPVVLAVKTWR